MKQEDIDKDIINIVDTERTQWERAITWLTPEVGYDMRKVIKKCRKNYWGVFEEPMEKGAKREKTWQHLTMRICEDYIKNINMSLRDLNFRAKRNSGYEIVDITRLFVHDYLYKMYFGETMDSTDRQLVIDGTVVWKTWEENGELKRETVDLLNFYIDPTAKNIQEVDRVTERCLYTPAQIKQMTAWRNTEGVKGSTNFNKNDSEASLQSINTTTTEYVDVWEMWGKIPKKYITFNEKDTGEIDAHVVVSGLQGEPRVHLIEENKRKDTFGNILKPYEELRDTVVTGIWYGLGRAFRIIGLQEYINTVVNTRINKNIISQLGLIKVRKGAGVTSKDINSLLSNGVITLTDINTDMAEVNINESGQSSYTDEQLIINWAQAITSANSISAGEELPASQTATASSIQNSQAKTAFTLTKEAKGMFFERWLNRHALPIIINSMKKSDFVRLSKDDTKFEELLDTIASNKALAELDKAKETGVIPTHSQLQSAIDEFKSTIRKRGDVLIQNAKDIMADSVEAYVYFTNEDLDTTVTVQNLMQMLQISPEYKDDIIKKIYDLMGLDTPNKNMMATMGQSPLGVDTLGSGLVNNPQPATTEAYTNGY